MTEVAGLRFRLYTLADLDVVIARMARQTLALLDPAQRPVVVGVLRRGAPLADRLVTAIEELKPGFAVDRLDLKVKRYSDDLHLLHPETRLDAPAADAPSVRNRQVLVIDDVLYQGYSFFRVFEFLRAEGAHDPLGGARRSLLRRGADRRRHRRRAPADRAGRCRRMQRAAV